VTEAVTLLATVEKTNPVGTFKTMVPVCMSPLASSRTVGPVSEVKGPPTESAEIVPPPLAGVTVAAAKTFFAPAKNKNVIRTTKKALLLSMEYIL
jgi:hypothetical protein